MIKVDIKPLSVNSAWQGRRFKSPAYTAFTKEVMFRLNKIKITLPEPPYQIRFKFGFSSSASDWDNCIKPAQDCLATKYGFNDKLIRKGIVETELVKKGQEYFAFEITTLNQQP